MINQPPPPLRADLKQRAVKQQGEVIHIIKEPDKGGYYRYDEAQYLMLTLFDGRRTPLQLVSLFNETSAEYEYDLELVQELIASAREFQLLERNKKEAKAALLEKIKSQRQGMKLQMQGSLLYMRFQLVDPEQWFNRVIEPIRWIWTPTGVGISLLVIVLAFAAVFAQGDRFMRELDSLVDFVHSSPLGLFGLWVVALTAIALHETAHGLTCKNFGGEVHDMGVLLMAFQPCLYCNVNDAWLFESTRHKVYVALAGIWAEMFLGALAAFLWIVLEPGSTLGIVCFVLMLVATATTLFMNLNPLMKFDGYYILSDLLETPNLRDNAINWFSYVIKTKAFRRQDEEPPFAPTRREARIYFIYGGLIVTYLSTMMAGLVPLLYGPVADHFGTLGIILFFFLVVKLARLMLASWPKFIKDWFVMLFLGTTRKKILMVILLVAMGLDLYFVQVPINIVSQGKVEIDRLEIHATENGFVRTINYRDDRTVRALVGEPLVVMESPQLAMEQNQLNARLEGIQLDRKRALATDDRNRLPRAGIETQSLQKQLDSIQQRIARLVVPTPVGSWLVDGPPPTVMAGRYFRRGEVLVTLIAQQKRLMSVTLEQSDLSFMKEGLQAYVRLASFGAPVMTGRVRSIAPVVQSEGAVRLFNVRVDLDIPPGSLPPYLGMKGEVRILGESYPLWQHLLRPIRKTFRVDLWL